MGKLTLEPGPATTLETHHKIGDTLLDVDTKEIYILALIGSEYISLINLQYGSRYSNPVKVADPNAITSHEFACAAAGSPYVFKPVNVSATWAYIA